MLEEKQFSKARAPIDLTFLILSELPPKLACEKNEGSISSIFAFIVNDPVHLEYEKHPIPINSIKSGITRSHWKLVLANAYFMYFLAF